MIPINATLDLDVGEMLAKSGESVMSADDLLKDVKEVELSTAKEDDSKLEDETLEDEKENDTDSDVDSDDDLGEGSETALETEQDAEENDSGEPSIEETLPKGDLEDESDSEEEDGDDEEDEEKVVPDMSIDTITKLARWMRNEGYKLSVFNIKDTLLRYLEMYGERKVARHVVDQDSHSFYEIHSTYVPGGALFTKLVKLGFKPLHPTQLDSNYPKDMSYEIAMSNGRLHIHVFGGLQQHAPNEETVIRNLYATEKFKYGISKDFVSTSSAEDSVLEAQKRVTCNLMLAAMQTHSLDRKELALEFFQEAMASEGVDSLMLSLSQEAGIEVEALDVSQEAPNKASSDDEADDATKTEKADDTGEESDEEEDQVEKGEVGEDQESKESDDDADDESEEADEDDSETEGDDGDSETEGDDGEESESDASGVAVANVENVYENAPAYVQVSDLLADKANNQKEAALTDEQRIAIMMPKEDEIFQVE